MTTSLTRVMNAINDRVIGKFWIGYFRESFRGEVNDQLLQSFSNGDQTRADVARRLDKRPEQITRWLSSPCNLELDTISDLALALGLVPKIRFEKVGTQSTNERVHSFVTLQAGPTQFFGTAEKSYVHLGSASNVRDVIEVGFSASTGEALSKSTAATRVTEIPAHA
jgi:hypothetical protein